MDFIGKKIKIMRKALDWSQEDLAREIGVSLSTVQQPANIIHRSDPSRRRLLYRWCRTDFFDRYCRL